MYMSNNIEKSEIELLYEKFRDQLKEELQIDEMNLKEKSMKAPSIKHYWVARLMDQRLNLYKYKKYRKEAAKKVFESIKADDPVKLSDLIINKRVSENELISKIDNAIGETELLIKFLEDTVDKVCKNISYDINNIIEINKLETT